MLIISKAQMKVFKDHSTEEFVQRTVVFLRENTPDWAMQRTDEAIAEHVRAIISWGHEAGIRKEISIQKILYNTIRKGCSVDDENILSILTTLHLTEDRRLLDFNEYLRKNG